MKYTYPKDQRGKNPIQKIMYKVERPGQIFGIMLDRSFTLTGHIKKWTLQMLSPEKEKQSSY